MIGKRLLHLWGGKCRGLIGRGERDQGELPLPTYSPLQLSQVPLQLQLPQSPQAQLGVVAGARAE